MRACNMYSAIGMCNRYVLILTKLLELWHAMDMGYVRGQHVRVNILNIIFYVKHTINFTDMLMQIFCPKASGGSNCLSITDIINN